MPGVRLVDVESFFKASTEFYRAAPWQRVGGTETIKVTCDRFESGPWYAVVIGQMGMTLGLALYENLETLVRMRSRGSSDEQSARETVALSVTFGDKTEIPVADLDAIEAHGWEIPAEDGYARPVRKERGLVMRPPLSWELKLLNACLQLVPRFVAEHDRGDFSEKKLTARVGTGELTLGLTWVER